MVLQKHFEPFMHNISRYKCADAWINGAWLPGSYYYDYHHGVLHISHWCSFEDQVRLIDLQMRCKTVMAWQGTGIVAPTNPVGRLIYNQTLQWRHNGRNGVSNHQPHHCQLNHLLRHWPKKTSKLTGLCAGNSPMTGDATDVIRLLSNDESSM